MVIKNTSSSGKRHEFAKWCNSHLPDYLSAGFSTLPALRGLLWGLWAVTLTHSWWHIWFADNHSRSEKRMSSIIAYPLTQGIFQYFGGFDFLAWHAPNSIVSIISYTLWFDIYPNSLDETWYTLYRVYHSLYGDVLDSTAEAYAALQAGVSLLRYQDSDTNRCKR